jgi:hypothetical protein
MRGQWHRISGGIYIFGKENENHELGTGFFVMRESYQQLQAFILLMIGCHT